MKKLLIALVGIGLTVGTIGNLYAGPKEEINEDTQTLQKFTSMPERQIPPAVLKNAKGFAIFHVIDVALLVNGKGGPGIVVDRTASGWSGPLFVGLGGAGVGAQLGAKVKKLVLVLNTQNAVDAFKQGNVKIGADLSAHAGPAGASAEAEIPVTAPDVYSYSDATGVFAGVSIEGSVIAPRGDVNNDFYGKKVDPTMILAGQVQPPAAANPLMTVLNKVAGGAPAVSSTR